MKISLVNKTQNFIYMHVMESCGEKSEFHRSSIQTQGIRDNIKVKLLDKGWPQMHYLENIKYCREIDKYRDKEGLVMILYEFGDDTHTFFNKHSLL